jgi:hypothetical protein
LIRLFDANGEESPSAEGDFDKDGRTDLAAIKKTLYLKLLN